MADFDAAVKRTMGHEGGFANDAADPGGKTNYGITEAVARDAGYTADMESMKPEEAKAIYHAKYWYPMRLGEVENQGLAEELFDTAVNCGNYRATRWLQQALNCLNSGARWQRVEEDGKMGPRTLLAANGCAALHPGTLLKAMNVLQGAHYMSLAHKTPRFRRFLRGWLDNRVTL